MKRIGIVHFKVGGTDGVSLEIDKWKQVLEEMGHKVFLCAGDLGTVSGTLIDEIFHHRDEIKRTNFNTFVQLRDYDEAGYKQDVESITQVLERRLRDFVQQHQIDFLIPQNVWSVALSPPLAIALARIVTDLGIPALAHNHDFYWERVGGVALTCATAMEIADKFLPPRDPLVKHAVINSLAQQELAARKGIDAAVIPNVFDFEAEAWRADAFNQDFRQSIGLNAGDVLILQATRIVPRKGIELAVDFVKALEDPRRRARLSEQGLYDGRSFDQDSRIVLVLAGYAQDDMTGKYVGQLKHKIAQCGIDAVFIEDQVGGRRTTIEGKKIYSLWDTYVYADFVTYPSLWEGWGNQLLEALRAKLPFMIYEYPVYGADIEQTGFRTVSLGSEISGRDQDGLAQVAPQVMAAAADEAVELLTNGRYRQETVNHNFELARRHYSMGALRKYLAQQMQSFEGG